MHLKPRARRWLMRFIGVACIAVCLVIAWYGFGVTISDYLGAERDVRSSTCRAGWWSAGFRCRF